MILDAALESLLLELTTHQNQELADINSCHGALNNILVMVLNPEFHQSLQQLKSLLPLPAKTETDYRTGGSTIVWSG